MSVLENRADAETQEKKGRDWLQLQSLPRSRKLNRLIIALSGKASLVLALFEAYCRQRGDMRVEELMKKADVLS